MAKASVGTWNKQVEFDTEDAADTKRAWMEAFNMTSERYDEVRKETDEWIEGFYERNPLLKEVIIPIGEQNSTDKDSYLRYVDPADFE